MKGILAILAIGLAVLFLLSGCASKTAEQQATLNIQTPNQTTAGELAAAAEPPSSGQILHLGIYTDQTRNLWIVNTDGTGLKKVLNKYVDAKWSPDSKKILYKDANNLFLMNPDGSGKKEILSADAILGYFDFSPDNRYVIFEEGSNIGVVHLNTFEIIRLTGDKAGQADTGKSPAYAGKDVIAFISGKTIYKVDTRGQTTEEWLTLNDPHVLKASPDGLYLSFNNNNAFWIVQNKAGAEPAKVADSVAVNYEWSPDSRKIVFGLSDRTFRIYDIASKTTATVNKKSEDRFSWSPDSRWVAFTYKDAKTYEDIWFVKSDGTGLQKFTNCPTACEMPDWG